MLWIDVHEIAIELAEKHPNVDPTYIIFTDLRKLVLDLDGFDDDPEKTNEKILEAIQMLWIEERE
ncbi:MAG: Fe-S assembly protein IscX [Gammaproteobacteria bacterium]|nr:Fe-S assembly protein IscX [Gammaproteobacteria bacterium]RZP03543.1 MAG: Fe-S assembly protein IscX [Gammaproteobacteria bacterium]|tara:strand:- start:12264 stop:12458 length:195 start_codon:yes stop_codon:yes gene_type:complete